MCEEGQGGRKFKDRVLNREGENLLKILEGMGWFILNGNTEGDEEGAYTRFKGDIGTAVDYLIGDNEIRKRIVRLEVGDHIDSDHFPIIVTLRGKRKKVKRFNKDIKIKRAGRNDWSVEGKKQFKKKINNWKMGERNVNEEIGLMIKEKKNIKGNR